MRNATICGKPQQHPTQPERCHSRSPRRGFLQRSINLEAQLGAVTSLAKGYRPSTAASSLLTNHRSSNGPAIGPTWRFGTPRLLHHLPPAAEQNVTFGSCCKKFRQLTILIPTPYSAVDRAHETSHLSHPAFAGYARRPHSCCQSELVLPGVPRSRGGSTSDDGRDRKCSGR